MSRFVAVSALVLLALGIPTPAARADAPLREGPFSFPFTINDFLPAPDSHANSPWSGRGMSP